MTKQHTPGPWICATATDDRNPEIMQHGTFASIATLSGMAPDEEMQANARVLAAAPDMLEALKLFVSGPINKATYEAARAAINKATGG